MGKQHNLNNPEAELLTLVFLQEAYKASVSK